MKNLAASTSYNEHFRSWNSGSGAERAGAWATGGKNAYGGDNCHQNQRYESSFYSLEKGHPHAYHHYSSEEGYRHAQTSRNDVAEEENINVPDESERHLHSAMKSKPVHDSTRPNKIKCIDGQQGPKYLVEFLFFVICECFTRARRVQTVVSGRRNRC